MSPLFFEICGWSVDIFKRFPSKVEDKGNFNQYTGYIAGEKKIYPAGYTSWEKYVSEVCNIFSVTHNYDRYYSWGTQVYFSRDLS